MVDTNSSVKRGIRFVCDEYLPEGPPTAFALVTKELEQGNNAADEDGIRGGPSKHTLLSKLWSTILLMLLSVRQSTQHFTTFTTQSFIWLNLALK